MKQLLSLTDNEEGLLLYFALVFMSYVVYVYTLFLP